MAPKKKPQKKNTTKEKITSEVPSTSAAPMSIPEISQKLPILQKTSLTITPEQFDALVDKHAHQLIKQTQDAESRMKKIETNKDLESLNNLVKEYLNSFILLGYTIGDERVLIQHVGTHKDKDALMELMKNIFLNLQQNGGTMASPDGEGESE